MFNKILCLSKVGLALLLFVGCAASHYRQGESSMKTKQYDRAINFFKHEIKKNPRHARAWRDMGIAYFEKGDEKRALTSLQKAHGFMQNDGITISYLGAIYEKRGDYAQAIQWYRQYTKVGRLSKQRREIEGRLAWVTRKQIEIETRNALANENDINVAAIPNNSVAVLGFQNLGKNAQLECTCQLHRQME
jgi:tetratricopeptide (TPR) repeat protein